MGGVNTGAESVRTPECCHKPDPARFMSYTGKALRAEHRIAHGARQRECEHCGRWHWRGLFRVRPDPAWMIETEAER